MTDISNEDLEIHRPSDDNEAAQQEALPGASANNGGEDGSTTRKRRGRSDASLEDQEEAEESTKRFKTSEDAGIVGEAPVSSSQPALEDTSMPSPASRKKIDDEKRWRVNQMTEDYVELASNMMLLPTNHLGPYGYNDNQQGKGENGSASYPLEHISAFGYLKSPLRRPTVIEKWSPYEISLFEAGMGHCGKDFFQIHKMIQTKSTKEVIDFYYVWKKTSHYKVWKEGYVPPGEIVSDDEYGSTPVKKAAR